MDYLKTPRMDIANLTHEEQVERLFLQNAGLLQGFILGFVRDVHRADDIFQELFITVRRKANEFTLGTDFLAWARAIARNKVLQHLDRERREGLRQVSLEPSVLECLFASAPEADRAWEPRRAALGRCVERLTPRTRELIDLRYGDGLWPREIAQKISWGVNAVNVALSEARKFLFECVRRQLAAEET